MSVWTGATPGSLCWEPATLQLRAGLTSGGGTRADSRPGRVACRGDGREDTRTPGEAGVDTAGLAGVVAAPEPAGRLSRWEERLSATSTR